ncbi:asparaginase [Actinacidiphila soli]|jgi:L-asparaginase|uniref:asparaginase n=1 Tax=Actinacidiphila soli TaxID=2487275 RepID=UPI000FCBB084|nr:asparaginase [Actinacidiphila soli]
MTKPLVAIASLGGTITMTRAAAAPAETAGPDGTETSVPAGARGVTPSLTAADLTGSVPELPEVAEIRAETLFTKPGASLGFAELLSALDWARAAVADGAAGVVLVQGTDTLEETSYFLDLYWDRPEPLIVAGAMRPPQYPSADGPANLLAATLTAAEPRSRGLGVLVVLNDEVHAAARVRKADSSALGAFTSVPFGPLARVHERTLAYGNRPARGRPAPLSRPTAGTGATGGGTGPRVALLETCLGDDGELLGLAEAAGYDGAVLSAFGAGHVSEDLAAVVSKAVGRIPVVFATRTGAGAVFHDTYGFAGSEQDLLRRGAIPAGWLDARKARLLLWALLAAGCDQETVRAQFAGRMGA